jgi:hypothetical protein
LHQFAGETHDRDNNEYRISQHVGRRRQPVDRCSKKPGGVMGTRLLGLLAVVALLGGCRSAAPPVVRFAPSGTDVAGLRNTYPLSAAERLALTPDNLRALTQEQVDQIYARLASGAIPDGAFRGDLFFPRGRDGRARIRDLADPSPGLLAHVAALRAERLGRVLWKGKVFFRSQRLVRNRVDDRLLLRPIIRDSDTIEKLTFDGETTWLLFPARLSCGESRFDPTRPSIVVDYSEAATLEGYRPVPDRLAGPEALNIRDEVRIIRPGFYLGRAYFGKRFALNFTLIDPVAPAGAADAAAVERICTDAAPSPAAGGWR